jgi:exopolysaccharide biosynthesis polyprenyl glycosylphosphotransferase
MIKEHHSLFKRVVLCIDLSLVTISLFAGYFLRDTIYGIFPALSSMEMLPLARVGYYVGLLPVLLIIWGALLSYFGMYKSFNAKISESFLIIFKSALTGFIMFGSYIFVLKMQQSVSRMVIVFSFLLAPLLISIEKIALFYAYRIISKRDVSFKSSLFIFRRILIVGTGRKAELFVELVNNHPDGGLKIVGLADIDGNREGEVIKGYRVLGSFHDMPEIIHNNIIDEVIFIAPSSSLRKIEDTVKFCESEGLRVNIAADIYDLSFTKAKHSDFYGFPLITYESTPDKLGYLFIKRLFDFAVSGISVIFLAPFLLIIFVIIKTNSEGPVFYKQKRCGLYGRKFTMYKFRTMSADAESKLKDLLVYNEMKGPVFKMANDPRITRAGKWMRKYSIDELPQLWNVLKGDMSLVGPRPPLPEEVERYTPAQRRRLSMRPGITCLWQIEGRSKIFDFDEWSRLDLEYIDNWSFGLDIKILLKSIPVVLFGRGAV